MLCVFPEGLDSCPQITDTKTLHSLSFVLLFGGQRPYFLLPTSLRYVALGREIIWQSLMGSLFSLSRAVFCNSAPVLVQVCFTGASIPQVSCPLPN